MTDNDDNPTGSREELFKLLKKFDTAIMSTISPDGTIHARPMATQKPRDGMEVWFVAGMESAKLRDLQANPRIGLAYYDGPSKGYISLSGTVRLDQDRARIAKLWESDWKMWFPEGQDDPDVVLIEVDLDQAEYVAPGTSRLIFLQALANAVTGSKEEPGEDKVAHVEL